MHDGVAVTFDTSGTPVLLPGPIASQVNTEITLQDFGTSSHYQLVVEFTVPDSGVVDLVVPLSYGLKHTAGYDRNYSGDAIDPNSGAMLIPNHASYSFEATTPEGDISDLIQSVNEFKKNPGVAGLVQWMPDETPVAGLTVQLINPSGNIVDEAVTDQDGFYQIVYKHKGKSETYTVAISGDLTTPQQVLLKGGNSLVEANFVLFW